MDKTETEIDIAENSNSLIARASQIMAIIIGLGLVSMITSMLVAESLSGDAAKINRAGQLRMLAVKVSRASISRVQDGQVTDLFAAKKDFDGAFVHLFDGGLTDALDDPEMRLQYETVAVHWNKIKTETTRLDLQEYDRFVEEIDQLVSLIQRESEEKIGLLRGIHGISLLLVIIVAFVVLTRLNRNFVSPLKKLIRVASAAGKGDFSLRSSYHEKNELGLLSKTINDMSDEIKLTQADLEQRVKNKTSALSRSNQTLALLYSASKRLSAHSLQNSEKEIVAELEKNLGFGKMNLQLPESKVESLVLDLSDELDVTSGICFKQLKVAIGTQAKKHGYLIWNYKNNEQVDEWQVNLIETIADMLASTRIQEQERVAENRLVIIEERAVIARELHDSLAQSLSYLKIQVALLTKKLNKELSREQIDATVEDIHLGLNRAYLQLRELLTTFRLQLDDPSLENSLKGTVTEFASKSNHPIELEYNLNGKTLSANQEIHVLQIVREALSNVHRHAKASKAEVNVLNSSNEFVVSISDDGEGMQKEHQLQGHFGLGIMHERAKSLNASLDIKSELGKGTRIRVVFNEVC
ncbi:MAG: histidine kinase [Kangiellaceae bacterium]|nr:histidine kinase [Kangiellaceae bacterium]